MGNLGGTGHNVSVPEFSSERRRVRECEEISVEFKECWRASKAKVRFDIVSECFGVHLSRTTEGFYDTASHRSQQASQHKTVYQKETTLPKRRCPRRDKPNRIIEASDVANQTTLHRRRRGLA